jgi:hypothetical protein
MDCVNRRTLAASNVARMVFLQPTHSNTPPRPMIYYFPASLRHSRDGNCRRLFLYRPFRRSDHVSGGGPPAQPVDALFEQFDSSPPRPTPPPRIELIRFEPNWLSEADSDGSRPWHEFSLCQNVMSTLNMRGHDGYSKVDRKQPSTLFKCLDLAVTRPRTLWIENQIAIHPL